MTTATFLIGLPASGKTTWRETSRANSFVASSDDFIEAHAKEIGKTYNEVFESVMDSATKHFNHMIHHAVASNASIIVDRTNLTPATRAKVLKQIPFDWEKVAIVFKCFDFEVWKERLMNRPGKLIPAPVLMNMMQSFKKPTLLEGFDRVVEYYT